MERPEDVEQVSEPDGRCQLCGDDLDPDGPSPDFCSEQHARAWAARAADHAPGAGGVFEELMDAWVEGARLTVRTLRPLVDVPAQVVAGAARDLRVAVSADDRASPVEPRTEGGADADDGRRTATPWS